jgi:hypothetical protein
MYCRHQPFDAFAVTAKVQIPEMNWITIISFEALMAAIVGGGLVYFLVRKWRSPEQRRA